MWVCASFALLARAYKHTTDELVCTVSTYQCCVYLILGHVDAPGPLQLCSEVCSAIEQTEALLAQAASLAHKFAPHCDLCESLLAHSDSTTEVCGD